MDMIDFYLYSIEERAELIAWFGEFISSIRIHEHIVKLYVVGGWLIEAYCLENGDIDDITMIGISDRHLALYVEDVDISSLFV